MLGDSGDEVSWRHGGGRDLSRVKLSASLKWLLHKAYDGNIPVEFSEPVPAHENDNIVTAHINSGVRTLLVNSKLYCAACERIFASWKAVFDGHWSVIQSLGRHGFNVTFNDDDVVTEADLLAVQPFNVHAHIAVIDTIMAAFLVEMTPVAGVMGVIRAVTSVSASKELPLSTEDALLLWVSKMWSLSYEWRQEARQLQLLHSNPAMVRINRSQLTSHEPDPPLNLQLENMVEVLQDGRCLAAVISWCFPDHLKMKDVCLLPSGSPQDAGHNWQLIGAFFSAYNLAGFHFAAEDLRSRTSHVMKSNVLVLVCELCFAFTKVLAAGAAAARGMPSAAAAAVSRAGAAAVTAKPTAASTALASNSVPQSLISEVTKRSFTTGQRSCSSAIPAAAAAAADQQQLLPAGSSTSRSDVAAAGVSSLPTKQPLLSKRQLRDLMPSTGVTRSASLSSLAAASGELKSSVCAWEDKNGVTHDPTGGPASDSGGGPSEPVTSSMSCSSRWGVYPCEPAQSGGVASTSSTVVQTFVAPPDSARTVTLSSRSPPPAQLGVVLPSATFGHPRRSSPRQQPASPAPTVSTCESADQECFNIMSSSQGQHAGSTTARPDTETPVTARSLVSNAALWCDDEDDVSVSPDPDSISGGAGFFLHRSVNAGSGLTNGSCSSSINGALPVGATQTNRGGSGAAAGGGVMPTDSETNGSGGMSRTTSFAELKQLSSGSSPLPSMVCDDLAMSNYHSPISSPLTGGVSLKTEFIKAKSSQAGAKASKKTTFALKQTTWVENAKLKGTNGGAATGCEMEASMTSSSGSSSGGQPGGSDAPADVAIARQHADVKLMLAERRRAIEASRRTASAVRSEERDEISREAFVQAVLKQRSASCDEQTSAATLGGASAVGSSAEEPRQSNEARATGGSRPELGVHDKSSTDRRSAAATTSASAAAARAADDELLAWPDASSAAAPAADDAAAVEDYGASLDKLSSSISELQFELARLALKQKHMEDASAAAVAAAAATGGTVAAAAGAVNSRHPVFALPPQVAVAAAEGPAVGVHSAAEHHASLVPAHVPRTSGSAAFRQPPSGTAGYPPPSAGQRVHLDAAVDGSLPSSPAPKATSRHGTVPLTAAAAAAASMSVEQRPANAGFARGGSVPPAGGASAQTEIRASAGIGGGDLLVAAAAAAATKAGSHDSGAFFVPVEAPANHSIQRRNSSDTADGRLLAKEMPSRVQPVAGKRATWCVSAPGTAVAAADPGAAAADTGQDDGSVRSGGEDGAVKDAAAADDDDVQRRRERFLLLQQRRHEDVEKRRRLKEAENDRRREEQRAKEMEADRKKAEERQRREHILQQYKERKAEDDPNRAAGATVSDSSGRLIAAPVPMRPRSSASRRSPATLNRHSSGAILGAHMDLLLPAAHGQSEISGAITHRRPISPSLSASDIAAINGRQSKKVLGSHGTSAAGDAVFGGHLGSQQLAAASGSLLAAPQPRQQRVSSPDPVATTESDPHGVAALKLYVQPSFKSNRGIIINAISHCVLAGSVNTDVKTKVLEELARSDAKHFLILFRDAHLQYRGIYAYNLDTEEVTKVSGQGPKAIIGKMLERFYKYNSGSKSFSEVTSTKHLSVSIDAVTIKEALWQKKPGGAVSTPKKGH